MKWRKSMAAMSSRERMNAPDHPAWPDDGEQAKTWLSLGVDARVRMALCGFRPCGCIIRTRYLESLVIQS
jgi:hypothetical protein